MKPPVLIRDELRMLKVVMIPIMLDNFKVISIRCILLD